MAASGRSGDTTHSHNGVNSFALSKLKTLEHVIPSVQERRYPDSPAVMRACIEQGICPFCGRDFRNLAAHTNRTHGINKDELKALAGIPKSHSACSAEFKQKLSDSAKSRPDLKDQIAVMQAAPKNGGKRAYSEAGLLVQRAKLEAGRQPAVVGRTNSERRRAATAERDAEIVARLRRGELLESVAHEFGLHPKSVKSILVREGEAWDLRTTSAQHPQRLQKAATSLRKAHKQYSLDKESECEQRLARWDELGQSWDSVAVLAGEWGVSEKSVRGFLRANGQSVPDGRQVGRKRPVGPYGRGVRPNGSGFSAKLSHNKTAYHLGTYRTPEAAAEAVRVKRVELGIGE